MLGTPMPRRGRPQNLAALALLILAGACAESPSRPASRPPPGYGQTQPPYPAYPQYPQGQPYPPPQQGPAPAQPPPGPIATPPAAPVTGDPLNAADATYLRHRAASVLGELVAALPAPQQQRVASIPFVFDPTVGSVNAFAACSNGKALMAITDGLLDIAAHLAQARANDEVFGTRKVDAYIQLIAQHQRPNAPIVRPPAGFFSPQEQTDARRVARQHDVFDELVAFVLGHELAHHYLGHLPCTGGAGVLGTAEIARVLSDAVPLFNQPNELAADAAGTNNVLTAGARRNGYRWTEGGGLLTMQFFSGVDTMAPIDVLFAFERTHPPPGLRVPVIQQTANLFRLGGGRGLPIPNFGG